MSRYAFKVYYSGTNYSGYQRQPNGNTIENFLELALIRTKLITSFQKNDYKAISRTDAGVHARGNVFTIITDKRPNLLQLNSNLPIDGSIIIWDFARICNNKDIHHPTKRYQYFLPSPSSEVIDQIDRIYEYLGTHDFSQFIKTDGAGEKDPVGRIEDIILNKTSNFLIITIIGNRFGREQIRRMIGFLTDPRFFPHSPKSFFFKTQSRIRIKPEQPNFLVLQEIQFSNSLNWEVSNPKLKYFFDKQYHKLKFTNDLSAFQLSILDDLI